MATTKARQSFNRSAAEIQQLIAIHSALGGRGPGRRYQLEVLNKSAIVLITAIWEAFCEDLAAEAVDHLVAHARSANDLPADLRRRVAATLKKEPHELAMWKLADEGWRDVVRARLRELTAERNWNMNTPKSEQVDRLFADALGLGAISASWKWPGMTPVRAKKKLDEFVALRGAIAHRGSASKSCRKAQVTNYFEHVKRLAGRTGSRVRAFIRATTGRRMV